MPTLRSRARLLPLASGVELHGRVNRRVDDPPRSDCVKVMLLT